MVGLAINLGLDIALTQASGHGAQGSYTGLVNAAFLAVLGVALVELLRPHALPSLNHRPWRIPLAVGIAVAYIGWTAFLADLAPRRTELALGEAASAAGAVCAEASADPRVTDAERQLACAQADNRRASLDAGMRLDQMTAVAGSALELIGSFGFIVAAEFLVVGALGILSSRRRRSRQVLQHRLDAELDRFVASVYEKARRAGHPPDRVRRALGALGIGDAPGELPDDPGGVEPDPGGLVVPAPGGDGLSPEASDSGGPPHAPAPSPADLDTVDHRWSPA